MSTSVLEKLARERDEARSAAMALAEADTFNPDDPTYVELRQKAVELDRRVGELSNLLDAQADADALDGRLAKASQQRQKATDAATVVTRDTWGSAFVRSDAFTGYRGRGTSGRFEIDDLQTRALPTGVADLLAAGLTGPKFTVDTTPPPVPTPLMDSVTQIQVTSNAIEYVSWGKVAGGAAKVAEKAAKPSAEFAPTVTSATLDNIAVYTQLTRQLIEDYVSVRDYIDGELRRDVARAEEADAAAVVTAGAASIPDSTGATLLESIRVGIGTVQAAGYNPTAILLNPADWAALDITVMSDTLTGPQVRQSFWGLTVVPSQAQAAGTAIVGDFRAGIHHYFRSAIALYITDSHADTFLSNVFTLLAERRGKTVLVRPQALTECST